MEITPEIMKLIKQSIDRHGNLTQFAQSIGVRHSTVVFWLSGKTKSINGGVWAKQVRPEIMPGLKLADLGTNPPTIKDIHVEQDLPEAIEKLTEAVGSLTSAVEAFMVDLRNRQ